MYSFNKNYKWKYVFDEKNQKIWIITWALVNLNNKKIIGFIYKKSFISYDFFLFDEKILSAKKIKIKTQNYIFENYYYDIISKPVKNDSMQYLWDVYDIEFDNFFNFKSILVEKSYFFTNEKILNKKITIFNENHILWFKKNYILVKDQEKIKYWVNNLKSILIPSY